MRPSHSLASLALTFAVVACSSRDKAADSASAATPAGNSAATCVEGGGTPAITAAGVGPLRIGGRVSEVATRCTVRDTSFSLGEGQTENGRVVDLGGTSAVLMVSNDAEPTIERIIVNDAALRTEEGLGIGKTVGALRAAYGRLCAMRGEGNVVVNVSSLPGVSFEVRGDIPVTANIERQPEAIPDNATISGIWLYGGRSACGGS
jgi:hypothetical protein